MMMISSSTVNRPTTMVSSTLESLLRLVSISMLWIPFRHVGSFQPSMHPLPRPSPPMKTDGCTLRTIGIHRFSRCDSLLNLSSSPSEESNSKHTIRWEKMFGLLSSYKEREGHANVPTKHKEDGENLGMWLRNQRTAYKAGKLQAGRQSKLESLGVQWVINSTATWDEMFDLLCAFKDREGHANAPQSHKEGGENLGTWLHRQRISYNAGKLQPERQSKLESLGVELQTKARSKTSWDEMFDLLCIFKEREGHANVPKNHKEGGENLGSWLASQRRSERRSDRKLKLERRTKLESLGVQWVIYSRATWDEMFDLLCIFKEREGHVNVPMNHKEDGENLGHWLGKQRQLRKTGKIQPERQSKLESLGMRWAIKSTATWDERFDLLCIYKEREGHANVPCIHKEGGENLGRWLMVQRASYKARKLQPERQSRLESLGVKWQMRSTATWDEMLDLLCIFKEREGHANAPQSHKEGGENLGTWLKRQRQFYKAGKLQAERQSKLESLGVRWKLR